MAFTTLFGNFLLSEWIWSMTWGFYQIPIAILLMTLLFKYLANMSIARSALFATLAQLFSFATFSLVVVGILITIFGIEYVAEVTPTPDYNRFAACMALAGIYAILQSLFFCALSCKFKLPLGKVIVATVVGNLLAAVITYWVLPAL